MDRNTHITNCIQIICQEKYGGVKVPPEKLDEFMADVNRKLVANEQRTAGRETLITFGRTLGLVPTTFEMEVYEQSLKSQPDIKSNGDPPPTHPKTTDDRQDQPNQKSQAEQMAIEMLTEKALTYTECKIPPAEVNAFLDQVSGTTQLPLNTVIQLAKEAEVLPSPEEIEAFNEQLNKPPENNGGNNRDERMETISFARCRQLGIKSKRIDRLEFIGPYLCLTDRGITAPRGAKDAAVKALAQTDSGVTDKFVVIKDIANLQNLWRYFNGETAVESSTAQVITLINQAKEAGVKSWGELNINIGSEPLIAIEGGEKRGKRTTRSEQEEVRPKRQYTRHAEHITEPDKPPQEEINGSVTGGNGHKNTSAITEIISQVQSGQANSLAELQSIISSWIGDTEQSISRLKTAIASGAGGIEAFMGNIKTLIDVRRDLDIQVVNNFAEVLERHGLSDKTK